MQSNSSPSRDRRILDSMPLMVFIVDREARVLDWNRAAAEALDLDPDKSLRVRGGELLNCIHHFESPGGCGTASSCKECVIRGAIDGAVAGCKTARRRTIADRQTPDGQGQINLLVSATPLDDGEVLLILEDVSEVVKLRSFLPICASCKKIRNDEQYWQSVEDYFKTAVGVDFSHGICPTCMAAQYPEIYARLEAKKKR